VLAAFLATALPALPAGAQEAVDPGAPPGAEQTARTVREFERYPLPVAPFDRSGAGTRDVTGRIAMTAFRIDDPDVTVAEIVAGYRARLEAAGFLHLFDCAGTACGGFDFRFGVTLLPAPQMLMDAADFAQLTMERAGEGQPPYVSVLASRVLGTAYVQTVVAVPGESALRITEAPEGPGDETLILPQDERSLLARLRAEGHVRVEGLVFDTGGARLSEGSAPALEMLARLLSRDPALSVAIVGHSDNAGGLEPNITLSRRRAEAVRDALIARGVPAGQMESHGVGWLAPVAANDTAAGRALNRRVELVLK
jgi:OOP family OmpA-OmpF porin